MEMEMEGDRMLEGNVEDEEYNLELWNDLNNINWLTESAALPKFREGDAGSNENGNEECQQCERNVRKEIDFMGNHYKMVILAMIVMSSATKVRHSFRTIGDLNLIDAVDGSEL
ncbi:hypothetical protein R1flu_014479 [Riccia fluitans]|uniref:Uncharacterized protein n=1 Tax=Riccia fluitans TaxID=41844 RepID=A0ABD1YG83_9MARC